MKKIKLSALGYLLAAAGSLMFATSGFCQIQVGSGLDSSFLVIEAAGFGAPKVFQWNYTYNAASPYTTADMLTAVDVASLELTLTIYSGNYLNAIDYSGLTLTNAFAFPYSPFWAQWVSGGTSGAPLAAMPSGVWSEGYGIADRELAPGSWDGLIFNGEYNSVAPWNVISATPSVAPVPEASSLALLVLGSALLLIYVRKGVHSH